MAKKTTKSKKEKKVETVDDFVDIIKETNPSDLLSETNSDKGNVNIDCKKDFIEDAEDSISSNESIVNNNEVSEIVKDTVKDIDESKEEPEVKPKSFKEVFGYNMMGMIYD